MVSGIAARHAGFAGSESEDRHGTDFLWPRMNRLLHQIRTLALRQINRRISMRYRSAVDAGESMPVFVIASRPDYHLAPFAIERNHQRIRTIVVANGVSGPQLDWLRRECGSTPVIPLRASFGKQSRNFLSHAEVISTINNMCRSDFCIQDADCFVTDSKWWDHMLEKHENTYASGPFGKPFNDLPGQFPDTYLVRINRPNYVDVCGKYRVGPGITEQPSAEVRRELDVRGIQPNWFPDYNKQYYDTLQLFWTAAFLSGLRFHLSPGAEQQVFHVGGSSYLTTREIEDPGHWDYWAVNTLYFHLRVLESPRFNDIRGDFKTLFQRYKSSDQLLAEHPQYLDSGRYQSCLNLLGALGLIRGGSVVASYES
jgi:hypothetical protein